jgi:hypothetical protein
MLHPKLHLLRTSARHRVGVPKLSRLDSKAYGKDLRKLQVGRGAQRRLSDAEIADNVLAEREAAVASAQGGRARRVTPLKIKL